MNQQREQEALLGAQREQDLLAQKKQLRNKSKFPLTKFRFFSSHIEKSALNSKLLLINLNSQRLDKEKQEVKNIVEQAPKRRTRLLRQCLKKYIKSYHKGESSISLNNTPQISLVNAITHDLPTEEPEYSLNMGDEHLSTILETELDEVIKSSVENLVPIPSDFEVTSDNERVLRRLCSSSIQFPPGNCGRLFILRKEIVLVEHLSFDLFLSFDDSMPPGIKNDDYDSEGDIHFLKEMLSNDPRLHPKMSIYLDHFTDRSSSVLLENPPDVGFALILSHDYVLPTLPILDPNLDFTPSHDSLGFGNNIFDPGIFIEVQSERLLSW
ncbi:hypothetical protein Tco_0749683 [Tanacetum coccineum]|uniref:Uncharacterized protein n=1 Tax=Tanacetum coccineum TaxID=301880 RepID=A0ABQ4Z281_9ASTR